MRIFGLTSDEWDRLRSAVTLPRVSVPRSPALAPEVEDLCWLIAGVSGRDAIELRQRQDRQRLNG